MKEMEDVIVTELSDRLPIVDHTASPDFERIRSLLDGNVYPSKFVDMTFLILDEDKRECREIHANRPVVDIIFENRRIFSDFIQVCKTDCEWEWRDFPNKIVLKGTSHDAFDNFLKYIYNGRVNLACLNYQPGLLLSFLKLAARLQFTELLTDSGKLLEEYDALNANKYNCTECYEIGILTKSAKICNEAATVLHNYSEMFNLKNEHRYIKNPRKLLGSQDVLAILEVEFYEPLFLNYLQFYLSDDSEHEICYRITGFKIDLYGGKWVTLIDQSEINCRSWQWIYFPTQKLSKIRISITDWHLEGEDPYYDFSKYKFKAKFINEELEFDPFTGYFIPQFNISHYPEKGYKFYFGEHKNYSYCLSEADCNEKYENYYHHIVGDGDCLEFYLNQTCLIESILFHMWDVTEFHIYDYKIQYKHDLKCDDTENWIDIFEKQNAKGVQLVHFGKRIPVRFIRIIATGTHEHNEDKEFGIVHFECPPDPDGYKDELMAIENNFVNS